MVVIKIPEETLQEILTFLGVARQHLANKDLLESDKAIFGAQVILWEYVSEEES